MLKSISAIVFGSVMVLSSAAYANETPIVGNVASKCSIYTDTSGVYGNPTPDVLSTDPVAGGVLPVIRYDVAIADYYKARILWPNSFTTSPNLNDALSWNGEVVVSSTSDVGMANYEASKIEYDNVTEYDLTVAGSTWFNVNSTVSYGVGRSFPGGTYKAMVVAECIAQ